MKPLGLGKGGLLLLAVHGQLFAQSNAPSEVTAPGTVITVTRFPGLAGEDPVPVTVITAEEIAHSPARTLPELLSLRAGIQARDLFGNNAANATVDMRGFGATAAQNTLILLDGRRLNDIDLSGVTWSTLPLDEVERIEIVRGSGAVQYGDGAVTGVVNVITRSPVAAQRNASVGVRAGSFDTQEIQASGTLSGAQTGLALGGSYYHSDGYRENNRNNTGNAYLDARWTRDRTTVSFKAGADAQSLRLPGARTVQPSAGIDQLETDRRGTSTPLDYATLGAYRVGLEFEQRAEGFDFTAGLGYRDKEQTSFFDFSGFPDYREIDLGVWAFTPRVRVPFAFLAGEAALVAGFDFYRWDYGLRLSNAKTNIGEPINRISAEQENRSVYLRLTAQLTPRTTAAAGARYERQTIDARDTFDPTAPGAAFGSGAPPVSQTQSAPAWELAVRQELSAAWALTARAGQGFRFATVDEIYETSASFTREFQLLEPQVSLGYDIGLEYAANAVSLRATFFQLDVEDEIHLDPFSTGIGNTNLPASRRRGLELGARWEPSSRVTAQVAYTYTDAEFTEGTLTGSAFTQTDVNIGGKKVPLVAANRASAQVAWQFAPQWALTGLVQYVSSQFMENDEGNTGVKIPAYTLVDVRVDFSRGPWSLTAAVNNLFAAQYYNYAVRSVSPLTPDRFNAYPLPERAFWLGAQYRFR